MARKRPSTPAQKASSSPTPKRVVLATNRRARRNYVIHQTIEAGLILLGSEVKSLRMTTPTLTEGFAKFRGDRLWLCGIFISPLPQASYLNHEPVRDRECLIKRRERKKLRHSLEAKGMTLVPLSMYFLGSRVKIELGVGKGRVKGDRRAYDKEKEDKKRMRDHTR